MEIFSYYSDYGNDSIQPKYPVTYMMLDNYFKKKIDDEMKRLTEVIEKKAESISLNTQKELKALKAEIKTLKDKIKEKKKEKEEPKTIADTFKPKEAEEPNE